MRTAIPFSLSRLLPLLTLILLSKLAERALRRYFALKALHHHFALSPQEIKQHDQHMLSMLSRTPAPHSPQHARPNTLPSQAAQTARISF